MTNHSLMEDTMYCDEHGTVDYCPECILAEKPTKNIRQKSEQFVKKYPNMFTEDRDWWIDELTKFFK